MPKLNLDNIEAADVASEPRGFVKLPAGGYVVKIVDVDPQPDREYVWLVFDIAEGEHAGYYADAFGISHPNSHRVLVSWKPTALPMLKGRLKLIEACNPGFDAVAAFEADKWELFNGRVFGLVAGEEEYESNTGEVRTRVDWFHAKWKTIDSIAAEDYIVPQLRTLDGSDAMPRVTERAVHVYDDDIPFE